MSTSPIRHQTNGLRSLETNGTTNIAVVGAGIIGLSTARELVRFFESNNVAANIDLYADKLGIDAATASYGAGGLFRITSEAFERISRSKRLKEIWTDSFVHFTGLCSATRAEAANEFGVFRAPAYYLTRDAGENINDRLWNDLAKQFYPDYNIIDGSSCSQNSTVDSMQAKLPKFAKGIYHHTLVVDTIVYMKRLLAELKVYLTSSTEDTQSNETGLAANRAKSNVRLSIHEGVHIDTLDSLLHHEAGVERFTMFRMDFSHT